MYCLPSREATTPRTLPPANGSTTVEPSFENQRYTSSHNTGSKMEVTAQNFDMKLGLSTILDKGKYPLTDEQVGGIINAFRTQNTLIKSQNSNGFEIKGINNESFYSGSLKDAVVKFAYENNHVSHAPKGVMIGSSMDALPAFQAEKLEAEHLKIMMSLGEGHGSKLDVENRMKKGLPFSTTMAKAYGLLK